MRHSMVEVLLGLLALALLASEICAAPSLGISPVIIRFPANVDVKTLTIYNGGDGLLVWTVASTPDGLLVDPPSGTNEAGWENRSFASMVVDRTGLADDVYVGDLVITSNGGTRTREVTMIVQNAPKLRVSPTLVTVSLDHTNRLLRIHNDGIQELEWSAVADQPWINIAPPASGTVPTLTYREMSVSLDPASLPSQDEGQSGEITVGSNGGNAVVSVIYLPSSRTAGILGLFSDQAGTNCNIIFDGAGLRSVYVVQTQTDGATAVQFSAPKPACWTNATYLSDTEVFPITVGNSQTGKAVAYGTCSWPTILATTINYFVQDPPGEPCCVYPVLPDPHVASGEIETVDCDNNRRYALAGYAIIYPNASCPCTEGVVRVEESTWGRIKALYAPE